jgi:addiction module HigA family antidote
MLREEYLLDFGWTPADLAQRLRVDEAVVDDLLAERIPLSAELALRLARLFGQTPAFWIKAQLACDLHTALLTADVESIEPVPQRPVLKAS